VTGNDVTSLYVIGSDQSVTSFDRKLHGNAVKGRKLAFWVCLRSYKALPRRRWQSRDRKCHVTSRARRYPDVTSFYWK